MAWRVITADQLAGYNNNNQQHGRPIVIPQLYNSNHQTPAVYNYNQANPWDTNPPPGTVPNIVWPQNQTPFQTQGGTAPWPHCNLESLYPHQMAPHGLPGNHILNQPLAPPRVHTQPDQNTNNNRNNSNLNKSNTALAVCPCCGNTTIKQNINKDYNDSSSSDNTTSAIDSRTNDYTINSADSQSRASYSRSSNNSSRNQHTTTGLQLNNNHNQPTPYPAHAQVRNDHHTQDPYMAYYMNQMKAYQDSINQVMNGYNPNSSQTTGDKPTSCTHPGHNKGSSNSAVTSSTGEMNYTTNNPGISYNTKRSQTQPVRQDQARPEHTNQYTRGQPRNGNPGVYQQHQLMQDTYQRSLDNMKKLQARFYNAHPTKQQSLDQHQNRQHAKNVGQESQGSSASSVSSRKDTDVNSFSSY